MSKVLKWVLAILLTVAAAYYQRVTGPTYPKKVKFEIADKVFKMKLPRSHVSSSPQIIELSIPDTTVKAELHFRRFKMNEDWSIVPFIREDGLLRAKLPAQPPAGKLEYFLVIKDTHRQINVPEKSAVIIRFKGHVPAYVLIPHVLFMFLSMLFALYTFFETISNGSKIKFYVGLTTVLLFIGGMVLGPIVQKFAFDAYWTGVPLGWDLTDNKTLIAFIFWLVAFGSTFKMEPSRQKLWIILAVVVMFLVFLIPHSVMGSELNYQTMNVETGKI